MRYDVTVESVAMEETYMTLQTRALGETYSAYVAAAMGKVSVSWGYSYMYAQSIHLYNIHLRTDHRSNESTRQQINCKCQHYLA